MHRCMHAPWIARIPYMHQECINGLSTRVLHFQPSNINFISSPQSRTQGASDMTPAAPSKFHIRYYYYLLDDHHHHRRGRHQHHHHRRRRHRHHHRVLGVDGWRCELFSRRMTSIFNITDDDDDDSKYSPTTQEDNQSSGEQSLLLLLFLVLLLLLLLLFLLLLFDVVMIAV